MSNGEEGSIESSMTLGSPLRLVTNHGRQPMQLSSGSVRSHHAATVGCTRSIGLHYPYQKKSARSEKQKAEQRSKLLNQLSMAECANLDSLGVKIIGIEFSIDEISRHWAN